MTAIELDDVYKSFGATPIIRGVSLAIEAGTRQALIGPNGAGKSTIFNLVTGKYPVTRGRVRLKGQDVTGLRPYEINRRGLSRSRSASTIIPAASKARTESSRSRSAWGTVLTASNARAGPSLT